LAKSAELNLQAEMGSLKTASAWHPDWHLGALTAISANGGLFRLPVKSTRILKKSRNSTHYLPIGWPPIQNAAVVASDLLWTANASNTCSAL
jgi:hypothetical protein